MATDRQSMKIPQDMADLFAFNGIDYVDQKVFQFHSRIMINIMEGLLDVTNKILLNKLSLPQLIYFVFIKQCCEEFILTLNRTKNNI